MRTPTAAPAAQPLTPPTPYVVSVMAEGYAREMQTLSEQASQQNRSLRDVIRHTNTVKRTFGGVLELREWFAAHGLAVPSTEADKEVVDEMAAFDQRRQELGPFAGLGEDSLSAAARTLIGMGWSHEGGEQWRPPFGKSPLFATLVPTVEDIVAGIKRRIDTIAAKEEGPAALASLCDAVNDALTNAGGDPLAEPTEKVLTVGEAVEALKLALRNDPEFAWVWHSNIAMPLMDSSSLGHRLANVSAAHLMRHLFDIDTSKNPNYIALMESQDRADAVAQPISMGIDLSAEALEEIQRSDGLVVPASGSVIEFFEHRLFSEKASEVRTLLSGLYDQCLIQKLSHIAISFGQLCDVMNLLEPVQQPAPAPVNDLSEKVIAEAAAMALGLRAPGDGSISTTPEPEPRPDMLDASENPVASPNASPCGRLYDGIRNAMLDLSHVRPGFNHLVDAAWNQLHGAYWSECPAPASAPGLRTVPMDFVYPEKGSEETQVKPSGNRRVFEPGDIVFVKGMAPRVSCEVVSYDNARLAVEIRPCDPTQFRYMTGSVHSPWNLELAPMAEAAKAVGQLNAVTPDSEPEKSVWDRTTDALISATREQKSEHAMKPTIGRRVWFRPDPRTGSAGFVVIDHSQPLDAGIVWVWSDTRVNLDVTDHHGNHHAMSSVYLVRPGEPPPPDGSYAEWMPFQIKQAAK